MAISRIDKIINERTRSPSLAQSRDARGLRVNLVLSEIEPNKLAVMSHVATTLALRVFTGPVYLYGNPDGPGVHGGTLGSQLAQMATSFGAPERIRWNPGSRLDGPTLFIGGTVGDFIADAAGWVSGVNSPLPRDLPAEAPACVFAVSCAFAQLFNKSLFGVDSPHPWTFSVRDLRVAPPAPPAYALTPIDFGRAAVLGAGAIGSAFAYTLWLSTWTGSLEIYDRDAYDEPNLETTCLIDQEHVVRCLPKAPALATAAKRRGLHTTGYQVDITASSPELAAQRTTFVCAVDNPETRRLLDSVAADILLNGAVGGSARDSGQVLFSRHGPTDPPLSVRYRERPAGDQVGIDAAHVPQEVEDACSRVAYEGVAAAAPFIATTTAAMLAAACVDIPEEAPNYLKLDLFGLQDRVDSRRDPRRT